MKPKTNLTTLTICLILIFLILPAQSTAQDDRAAAAWKIRTQAAEIIELTRQVKTARGDSVTIELLRGITIQGLERDLQWVKSNLPHWYERPAVVVPVTAMIVIWAVLRMISLSV